MRVVITAAAKADLLAIRRSIACDNPARALSFVEELLDRCQALADTPRAYPLVPRYEHRDTPSCPWRFSLICTADCRMVCSRRVNMATEQTSRLEARLPASVYATLKRAARLKGRSLTDFVVSAAHDAAQRAIEEDSLLRLSAEDQQRFAEALINPPKPNAALKQAKRLHLENVEAR